MAQPVFSACPQTTFVLSPGIHFVSQLVFLAPLQKIMGLAYQRRHDVNALPNFAQYYVRNLWLSLFETWMCIVCFLNRWQMNGFPESVLNCLENVCFNLSNSNIPILIAGVQFQNANGIMQVFDMVSCWLIMMLHHGIFCNRNVFPDCRFRCSSNEFNRFKNSATLFFVSRLWLCQTRG